MPGIASGLLEGIEAGSGIALRQQALKMDQQRLQLEKTRQDTELARQQHLDTISALQAQRENLANAAQPHLGYLHGLDQLRTQDPTGYAAALNSDEYKTHASAVQDLISQSQDVGKRLNQAYSDFAIPHWQQTHANAQQDAVGISAGVTNPATMPPNRLAGLVQSGSGLPPEQFVVDPKTGQMPAQVAMDPLHQAIHTGDWSKTGPAMTLLLHDTQTAIGHPMAGGTVTGVQLGAPVPGQDGTLTIPQVYQIHKPDGSSTTVNAPPVKVQQSVVAQRAAQLDQYIRGLQHPDIQQNLQTAVSSGQTPYGELTAALASTGLPPSAYTPATEYKNLGPFDRVIAETPGQAPRIVIDAAQTKNSAELAEIKAYMDANHVDYNTAMQAVDLSKRGLSEYRNPNVRPAPAPGTAPAGPKQGARILASRAAKAKITAGYHKVDGQWVDKDDKPAPDDLEDQLAAVDAYIADPDLKTEDLKVDKILSVVKGGSGGKPGGGASKADFVYDPSKPRGQRMTAVRGQ